MRLVAELSVLTQASLVQSVKLPDALLRIGQCQAGLGAPAAARATWQRLVRAHPRSAGAVQARGLLGAAAR
jgi:TolA-binding protein